MKQGVILAGGNGTRLRPMTRVVNKHLLPVYDRPMIEYPLQTLIDLGCRDILIISGGEHIGGFAEYLGDGSEYGVDLTYRVQKEAGGVAEALLCAEGYVTDDVFPVILGDNYFDKPVYSQKPAVVVTKTDSPERFGVYDPKAHTIVEKPEIPPSDMAVTGLYWYDKSVFEYINTLEPSARGELEITDVNNIILKEGADVIVYSGHWSDMGTVESLMEVSRYIHEM